MIIGKIYKLSCDITFYQGEAMPDDGIYKLSIITLPEYSILMPVRLYEASSMMWWTFVGARGLVSTGFPRSIRLATLFKEIE